MNIIRRAASKTPSFPVIMQCVSKPVNGNAPETGGLIVYFIDKSTGLVLNNDFRNGITSPVGTVYTCFADVSNPAVWQKCDDEFVLSN